MSPYNRRFHKRRTYIMPPRETNPEKMALAAREDLPEEAAARLLTVDKLLAQKSKGGLMTSMWASSPDEKVGAKLNEGETSSSGIPVLTTAPAATPAVTPAIYPIAEKETVSLDVFKPAHIDDLRTPDILKRFKYVDTFTLTKSGGVGRVVNSHAVGSSSAQTHIEGAEYVPIGQKIQTAPDLIVKGFSDHSNIVINEEGAQVPISPVSLTWSVSGGNGKYQQSKAPAIPTWSVTGDEIKAQGPTLPAFGTWPVPDGEITNVNTSLSPQVDPQKAIQFASSWQEFNTWGSFIRPSNHSTGGHPFSTTMNKFPEKDFATAELETKRKPILPDVVTAKGKDKSASGDLNGINQKPNSGSELITQLKELTFGNPVSMPTFAQEHLSLLPRPRVEEKDFKVGRDLFLINLADTEPVSESGQRALDQAVSDDGVGDMNRRLNNAPINSGGKWHKIRNNLRPRTQFEQGRDGPMSAPYNVSNEGNSFAFIPIHVGEWAESVPDLADKIDVESAQFTTGVSPIINMRFGEPIEQPTSYPDIANSSNKQKQQSQTADIDAKFYQRKRQKKQRYQERNRLASGLESGMCLASELTIPVRNPWTPRTATYLRTAQEKDIPGITAIYNYYVTNSILPEDQVPVAENKMHRALTICRAEMLPFIVAIRGAPPTLNRIDEEEAVLGFGFTDDNVSSIGLSCLGRSRYTAQIEFYVHNEYLRKGIGQCILDRLLSVLGPCHTAHDGYDFVYKPGEENLYGSQPSGGRRFHQVYLYRPVQKKNDPDIAWFTHWLKRFYIFEAGRLISHSRSSKAAGFPCFLDLVIFQFEAVNEAVYTNKD